MLKFLAVFCRTFKHSKYLVTVLFTADARASEIGSVTCSLLCNGRFAPPLARRSQIQQKLPSPPILSRMSKQALALWPIPFLVRWLNDCWSDDKHPKLLQCRIFGLHITLHYFGAMQNSAALNRMVDTPMIGGSKPLAKMDPN